MKFFQYPFQVLINYREMLSIWFGFLTTLSIISTCGWEAFSLVLPLQDCKLFQILKALTHCWCSSMSTWANLHVSSLWFLTWCLLLLSRHGSCQGKNLCCKIIPIIHPRWSKGNTSFFFFSCFLLFPLLFLFLLIFFSIKTFFSSINSRPNGWFFGILFMPSDTDWVF